MKPDQSELLRAAQEAHQKRDLVGAGRLYTQFVQLNPQVAEAWEALAAVLAELRNYAGAEECLSGIVRFRSDFPHLYRIHAQLAWLANAQGRAHDAVAFARKAVELNPQFEPGWYNLAVAYDLQGDFEGAISCYDRAASLGCDTYQERLYFVKRQACAWENIEELERVIQAPEFPRNINLWYLGVPGTTKATERRAAEDFARQYPRRYLVEPGVRHRVQDRKIRLAYISNEFHDSPTARCLVSTIENHDRDRFELHAYSYGPERDVPLRQRIKQAFDQFHDMAASPSQAIALQIKAAGIDILVDLTGYLGHHRADILARRPAPVQMSYLGWPATMGAPFIDYLIADPMVAPDPAAFSEKLVYLDCYLPTDANKPDPQTPPRAALGLPEEAIILCAMNTAWKITPSVMEMWCNILSELPQTVLWLAVRHPTIERNLRSFAQRHDVADRVILAPAVPYQEHVDRIGAADLGLDTSPYGGHATTSDLLFAGVPVVTCKGETFASRVGASLLAASGLPELATSSLQEYRDLVLSLCRDRPRLAAMKASLCAGRRSSRLFDNRQYTKAFEARLMELVS